MKELIEIKEENNTILFDDKELTALTLFKENKVSKIVKEIKEKLGNEVFDVETEEGRKSLKKHTQKIKKSATTLVKFKTEAVRELKELPKIMDANCKKAKDDLETFAEQQRKPLTEWEEKEAERIRDIQSRINAIDPFNVGMVEIDLDVIGLEKLYALLALAEDFSIDTSLDEFQDSAEARRKDVILKLSGLIAQKEKQIKKEQELLAKQKEADEKARKEREERIAKEAAEQAKKEAEAKAEREKQEILERERIAKEAKERAERERIAAEERAKIEQEQAVKAEQDRLKRIEEERQAKIDEEKRIAEKKATNKRHRAKINNQLLKDLEPFCKDEETTKKLIVAIATNEIRNLFIEY